MSTPSCSSDVLKIPKRPTANGFSICSIYVPEMVLKDGAIHVLTQDKPGSSTLAVSQNNKWSANNRKARQHIVMNVCEEPVTRLSSFLISDATTKEVRNNLKDSYRKENIQSKRNLRTHLDSIS